MFANILDIINIRYTSVAKLIFFLSSSTFAHTLTSRCDRIVEYPIQKLTGETPEVRSDERKPREKREKKRVKERKRKKRREV